MDFLIRNNIMKQNRAVLDIGHHAVKVLEVHYAARRAEVTDARMFDAGSILQNNSIDAVELAKRADSYISSSARHHVSISLPPEICENKIVTIKNKKESEIAKIVEREYVGFSGVSNMTHVIDYAYLGTLEEQGNTVHYVLLMAASKTLLNELVSEFAHYGMKVKTIVSGIFNQVCLSELYFDEYESLNRLMIDFGTENTRIIAFCEGTAVYTRTLNIGYNHYVKSIFSAQEKAGKQEIIRALTTVGMLREPENRSFSTLDYDTYMHCAESLTQQLISEIRRVLNLCESNDIMITKIYGTGFPLPGFMQTLELQTGIGTEQICFGMCDEKNGKGYVLWIGETDLGAVYSNALGLAVYPML